MYYKREDDFKRLLDSSISNMQDWRTGKSVIVVTNETGLGNVPFDETTRRYNMLLA
jgi:adenosylcobinamide kinase/adenosylcobinamide-phosphate guanylyltransferase